MKKIISIILVATTCVAMFAGCASLEIKEQPDRVVISAEKIYPEAIGNYITDASVNIPSIVAYMEEYNKNADETAKINYTTIKYNKAADYYYVNDATTDVGMKFRLDSTQAITSASIYTGTLDQPGKNVYNIVINAIETSGYKTLMTDEDRALIQYTIDGFNGVSAAKQEVQQLFNREANFAAKWSNEIAEFEIPVKPTELPKPDSSHTLMEVTFPTVEIPPINLDTTIVEGTHLSDMTPVKPKDFDNIAANIQNATGQVAAIQQYTNSNVDFGDLAETKKGVDNIKINTTIADTGMQLTASAYDAMKLATSPETAKLPCTQQIMAGLNDAYKDFTAANKITKDKSCLTLPTDPATVLNSFYDPNTSNQLGKGTMLFNADGTLSSKGSATMNVLNTIVSNASANYDPTKAMGELKANQQSAIDALVGKDNSLSDSVEVPKVDKDIIADNHQLVENAGKPACDRLKANIRSMYDNFESTQNSQFWQVVINPLMLTSPMAWDGTSDEDIDDKVNGVDGDNSFFDNATEGVYED